MVWETTIKDPREWCKEFIESRYSKTTEKMLLAWQKLFDTAYGPENKLYLTAPSYLPKINNIFKILSSSPCYPVEDLARVWEIYLDQYPTYSHLKETYKHDLTMITAQILHLLLKRRFHEIHYSSQKNDIICMKNNIESFLEIIKDLDLILQTRKEFLLGKWISEARNWGNTEEEKQKLEWGALMQVTLWDNVAVAPLNNYARKDWAGLVKDYYYTRWNYYFKEMLKAAEERREFNKIDTVTEIGHWEKVWATAEHHFIDQPVGDTFIISQSLFLKYSSQIFGEGIQTFYSENYLGIWTFLMNSLNYEITFLPSKEVQLSCQNAPDPSWEKVKWEFKNESMQLFSPNGNLVEVLRLISKTILRSHYQFLPDATRKQKFRHNNHFICYLIIQYYFFNKDVWFNYNN